MADFKLKPCPFCGGNDLSHYDTYQYGGPKKGEDYCGFVSCNACLGSVETERPRAKEDSLARVVEKWNRRCDREQ